METMHVDQSVVKQLSSLGWSWELLFALSEIAAIGEFAPRDVLCRPGAYESFLGILLEGKLFVQTENGTAKARIEPVDIFGEISFILPKPRSAHVVASRQGRYVRIDFAPLSKMLAKAPHLAAEWYCWLASRLAERVVEETQDERQYIALIAHDNKNRR